MPEPVSALMLEFLEWVDARLRTYAETMEAWRTGCPRHAVWEDALFEGLIQLEERGAMDQSKVTLTSRGKALLRGSA